MCAVTQPAEFHVPVWPASTAAARDFTVQVLCPQHAAAVVPQVCQVVNELVAAAVMADLEPLWLHLDCWTSVVSVTVTSRRRSPVPDRDVAQLEQQELAHRVLDGLTRAWALDWYADTWVRWAVLATAT